MLPAGRPPEAEVLDQLPIAVITVDLDHLVAGWSRGAERLYGWTTAEALGRSIRELVFSIEAAADGISAQTHSGRSWNGEVLVRHRDGSRFLVQVRNVPLLNEIGEVVGVLGVSWEVPSTGELSASASASGPGDVAAQRVSRLQLLTAALVPAGTVGEVVAAVLDAGLTALDADAGALLLLEEDALLRVAGVRGFQPEVVAPFTVLSVDSDAPVAEAVRRRTTLLFPDHAAFGAAYPKLGTNVGFEARAAVPVFGGNVLEGALSLAFSSPHAFDDEEVQLLHTLAALCGQALERCRLLAAEQAASAREAFVGRASDVLSRSLSPADTLDAIGQLLVPSYGDWLVLHVREEDRFVGRGVAHRDPDALKALGALSLGQTLDLASDGGPGEAVRTRLAVLHTSVPKAVRRRMVVPEPWTASARELGASTGLSVPMIVGDQVVGTISLARVDGAVYDEADVSVVELIATRAAVALAHAQTYERSRAGAVALQRNLLPQNLPDVPGLTFAWRYLPGAEGALVGGDWYDVFPLAHGRIGLVIGDVMGHGMVAAAVMGQLRAMARAYAQAGLRPAEVLSHLDRALPELEQDSIATLLFLELDPATATVVGASAGHLPAVVVGSHGATLLEFDPGPPLGAGPGRYLEARRSLPRGSTLLLYTDGLVEDRTRSLSEGLELLLSSLTRDVPDTTDTLCDQVLHDLGRDEANSDDTALLVVALHSELVEAVTPFVSMLVEDLHDVQPMRHAVQRRSQLWHLPDDIADDVLLIATELTTNALLHAGPPVSATVRLEQTAVRIEVHDAAPDLLPLPPLCAGPRPEDLDLDAIIAELETSGTTGRGMHLVERLTSSWEVQAEPGGKIVWAAVPLTAAVAKLVPPAPEGTAVSLRGIPVRLVLASAANLDDLIRELTLRADDTLFDQLNAQGRGLITQTARTQDPVRLAARDALARGQRLVDVSVPADQTTVGSLAEFQNVLDRVLTLGSDGSLLSLAPTPEISSFRSWWRAEIAAQLDGKPPSPCPFPALP